MEVIQTRSIRIGIGESLRTIAARELSDPSRWIELAELNQLRPPYIIESIDPSERIRGTLIFGDMIRIPLGRISRAPQSAEDVLGSDVHLSSGEIQIGGGDYALVSSHENLKQALAHRIKTSLGELITHPDYGCNANVAIGMKIRSLSVLMLAGYVRRAILSEPRVARLNILAPRVRGDAVEIYANVTPAASNSPFDLNLVFPAMGN